MELTSETMNIKGRQIGCGHPVYVVAEMSANHNQDFSSAVEILKAAKEAGADAVKLQTYTADTMTLDCKNEYFRIKGSIWDGRWLYDLYKEAHTPWEWQPKLKEIAEEMNLHLFSTPFDATAVEFLEEMDVPAYKVASFEIVDIPLLRKIASTGKPIILSTGMCTLSEIEDAVDHIREEGKKNKLAILKCTSSYPASPEDMNLRTIPHLASTFNVPVGLSDHTLGAEVPIASVALGACIVEKHLTLSRKAPGPDAAFSMEPKEFSQMVKSIRITEKVLGRLNYKPTAKEKDSRALRRSLFVVKDMEAGEEFSENNVRSIRPGDGLHTSHLNDVIGRRAKSDIRKGTPLSWNIIT